jgi:hypothetical protein
VNGRLALAVVAIAGACKSPAPTPAPSPSAASSAPAPKREAAPPMYLPPERAGGFPYCFDPHSESLRAAVKRKRFEEGDALDAAALADDVRDLHGAMERLYAGYPELLHTPSFDVDRFFEGWERGLRDARTTVSFGDGVLAKLVDLRHHIRDNHLMVWGYGLRLAQRPDLAFSEYQLRGRADAFDPARCTFDGASPVEGTARVAKQLSKNGLDAIATFSAQSTRPFVDVRCGDASLRFERRVPHSLAHADDAPVYERRTVGDATVIVVRRLHGSPKELEVLAGIAKDYDEHRKKPTVVFDFRGNGGGNDGYVGRWILRAARGKIPPPYIELRIASANACGDWNQMVFDQISYDRVDTAEARAERDALVAKHALGGVRGEPAHALDAEGAELKGETPYAGRVIAIVDNGSASSGESAPDALRLSLGATIVGERTGGFAEFGNIRPYVMPRTGVGWNLASKRNYYTSPRDGVGIPIDVYLDAELLGAKVEDLVPLLAKLPKK